MNAPQLSPAGTVVTLAGLDETERFAARCAAIARRGDVFALHGNLGAGKTAFARAFINAVAERNGAEAVEVPSPTFTLVQVYAFSRDTVYHFDLYRIDDPDDVIELGLDDALAEGITLIEWPERLGELIPGDRLELDFDFPARERAAEGTREGAAETDRVCTVRGWGGWAGRAEELTRDD